jgi:hypothetical protein
MVRQMWSKRKEALVIVTPETPAFGFIGAGVLSIKEQLEENRFLRSFEI